MGLTLGQKGPLDKEMATHSSIPAWEIQSWRGSWQAPVYGSQKVRHNWATKQLHNWATTNTGENECGSDMKEDIFTEWKTCVNFLGHSTLYVLWGSIEEYGLAVPEDLGCKAVERRQWERCHWNVKEVEN